MKNNFLEKLNLIIITLIFLFFLFLLKDNFVSKFSIIDDHEIINNVNRIKKIGFISNYTQLIQDDIQNSRFRLSYWFLRNIEFLLFGYNEFLYYLFHFVTITSGFILLYLVFIYFFRKNFILSFLTTIVISLNTFWSDIYTRLAPNERYAFFFLSLWLFVLVLILKSKKISFFKNSLFLLSSFFVSFSKENFLIFIPISFFIEFFFVIKKRPKKIIIIFSFFYFLLITLLTLFFVFKIKSTGYDVYGRPTSFLFRLLTIRNNFKDIVFNYGLIEALFWLTFILFSKKRINLILGIFNLLLFLIILIFNYFINLGQFLAPRYFFPVVVLKFYFLPVFYFLSFNNNTKKNYDLKFINSLIFIYLIINLFFTYKNFYIFKEAIRNKNTWIFSFDSYINKIVNFNKNEGVKKILFVYETPYYEQMFSTMTFLNYKNPSFKNYILLSSFSCNQYQNFSLEKKLCEVLIKNRKKFQEIYKFELINIDKLNKIQDDCLMITSSRENLMNKCRKVINYF